jgi:hypothetical protein
MQEHELYPLLIGLWACSALFGMAWNAGCLFVLVGWWAIPLLLILGPIWLLIAASLEQKQQCPHCKKMIPGSASRCSFCQGEVVPLITTAAQPSAPTHALPALVATEPGSKAFDEWLAPVSRCKLMPQPRNPIPPSAPAPAAAVCFLLKRVSV